MSLSCEFSTCSSCSKSQDPQFWQKPAYHHAALEGRPSPLRHVTVSRTRFWKLISFLWRLYDCTPGNRVHRNVLHILRRRLDIAHTSSPLWDVRSLICCTLYWQPVVFGQLLPSTDCAPQLHTHWPKPRRPHASGGVGAGLHRQFESAPFAPRFTGNLIHEHCSHVVVAAKKKHRRAGPAAGAATARCAWLKLKLHFS